MSETKELRAQLKHAYHSYLDDALRLCSEEMEKGIRLSPKLPWYWQLPISTNVLPVSSFILKLEGRLSLLPSYRKCVQLLEDNPTTSKYLNKLVGAAYGATRVETKDLIQRLLSDYLTRVPDASTNEEVFKELYNKQEQYLYSDIVTCMSLTPLVNLQGDFETLELSTGLRIRKMNDEDKRMLGLLGETAYGQMDAAVSKYAIEQIFDVPKDVRSSCERDANSTTLNDQVLTLLTALRLFKSGIVGVKISGTVEAQWSPHSEKIRTMPLHQPSYSGPNYSLQSSELEAFKRFYEEYLSFRKEEFVIALGRFNSYYDKRSEEDRLIDEVIAFENLLLHERDELALRLALRAANLLGGGAEEKRHIFVLVKKAYDLRSGIVHGKAYDSTVRLAEGESLPMGEFVQRVEDCLRRMLLAMLRRRQTQRKNKIIEEINNPF